MAYMNLLIREKADLDDTPEQYKADTDTADKWVQKALDTKKMKAPEGGWRRRNRAASPRKTRSKRSQLEQADRLALRSVTCPMR